MVFPTGYCNFRTVTCSAPLGHSHKQRGMPWPTLWGRHYPLWWCPLLRLLGLQLSSPSPSAKMPLRSSDSCFAGLACSCFSLHLVYRSSPRYFLIGSSQLRITRQLRSFLLSLHL